MRSATMRASVSVGPPAAKGTTMVIWRDGYVSARTAPAQANDTAQARPAMLLMIFVIVSSDPQLSERGGIRNSEFRRKVGPIHPHQATDGKNSCCGATQDRVAVNPLLTKKHGIAFVFQRHRQGPNDIAPVSC